MKFFPVMAGPYGRDDTFACVPWAMVEVHNNQAFTNHSQSVQRLAERGGLGWGELAAVLEDRKWHQMDQREACKAVMAHVVEWARATAQPGDPAFYRVAPPGVEPALPPPAETCATCGGTATAVTPCFTCGLFTGRDSKGTR